MNNLMLNKNKGIQGDTLPWFKEGLKFECQCRAFPFWGSNLENRPEWEKLKNTCPGVDKGKLHTLKDIQDNLKIYEERFGVSI